MVSWTWHDNAPKSKTEDEENKLYIYLIVSKISEIVEWGKREKIKSNSELFKERMLEIEDEDPIEHDYIIRCRNVEARLMGAQLAELQSMLYYRGARLSISHTHISEEEENNL